jgi:hypothetical protein
MISNSKYFRNDPLNFSSCNLKVPKRFEPCFSDGIWDYGSFSNSKGRPLNFAGCPSNSKGRPQNSKGRRANFKGCRANFKGCRANFKGRPSNFGDRPSNQGLPLQIQTSRETSCKGCKITQNKRFRIVK